METDVVERGYVPHMRHRRESDDLVRRYPRRGARLGSLNRFRRLLMRREKRAEDCRVLVQVACGLTIRRRTILG
jgi:hypothetical protein